MKLNDSDIIERFIRGSGSGGQKINKTSSTVELVHLPTGLSVRCQNGRSQVRNRELARELLEEKVKALHERILLQRKQAKEKIKRQKRGRNKKAKENVLKNKLFKSHKKLFRKKISSFKD